MPADKEQCAIKKGEELGFTSREPSETKERQVEGEGRVILGHGLDPGSWKSEKAGALALLLALWSSVGQYP